MYGQSMLRPTTDRAFPRTYGNRDFGRNASNLTNLPRKTSNLSNLPRPQFCPSKALARARGSTKISCPAPPRIIKKDEKDLLLRKLTPVQYRVTQEKVTERPYSNKYYKHFEKGIYSCVVCKEPIFVSTTKYDAKSGWPAFYDIIDENKVRYKQDLSHVGANLLLLVCNPSLARTEVSCAVCNAHLGHMFEDGPRPTGKRFCVNSSSLTFSSVEGEKLERLKRGKEEDVELDKRKKFGEQLLDTPDGDTKEPLVHLASPANSCSMGSRICFRVPHMDSYGPPTS